MVVSRQLIDSTGGVDSASYKKAATEMSLRSLQRCVPTIVHLVPFGTLLLRRAAACDRGLL